MDSFHEMMARGFAREMAQTASSTSPSTQLRPVFLASMEALQKSLNMRNSILAMAELDYVFRDSGATSPAEKVLLAGLGALKTALPTLMDNTKSNADFAAAWGAVSVALMDPRMHKDFFDEVMIIYAMFMHARHGKKKAVMAIAEARNAANMLSASTCAPAAAGEE